MAGLVLKLLTEVHLGKREGSAGEELELE